MMGCDYFCMWVVCSDRDALIFRFLFKRFFAKRDDYLFFRDGVYGVRSFSFIR